MSSLKYGYLIIIEQNLSQSEFRRAFSAILVSILVIRVTEAVLRRIRISRFRVVGRSCRCRRAAIAIVVIVVVLIVIATVTFAVAVAHATRARVGGVRSCIVGGEAGVVVSPVLENLEAFREDAHVA